jgi:hypothetical protein
MAKAIGSSCIEFAPDAKTKPFTPPQALYLADHRVTFF